MLPEGVAGWLRWPATVNTDRPLRGGRVTPSPWRNQRETLVKFRHIDVDTVIRSNVDRLVDDLGVITAVHGQRSRHRGNAAHAVTPVGVRVLDHIRTVPSRPVVHIGASDRYRLAIDRPEDLSRQRRRRNGRTRQKQRDIQFGVTARRGIGAAESIRGRAVGRPRR